MSLVLFFRTLARNLITANSTIIIIITITITIIRKAALSITTMMSDQNINVPTDNRENKKVVKVSDTFQSSNMEWRAETETETFLGIENAAHAVKYIHI